MTFLFHKDGHRYELDGKRMTGVTTVLGVIAKPMLIGWAAKQTAEWIRENCDRVVREEQQRDFYEVTESQLQEAVKAHTKKKEEGGQKGTDLHSEVEMYIKACMDEHNGEPFMLNGDESPGLTQFMNWAQKNQVRFLASEQQVYSREWWCAGTFDFSFEKDSKRYIGDLKTMKKLWDRVPFFQTAAYRKMSMEMGQEPYDGSCIVNISKENNILTDHWSYDWEGDTKAFEAALTLYRQLSTF